MNLERRSEENALRQALIGDKWKDYLAVILCSQIEGYCGTKVIEQDLLEYHKIDATRLAQEKGFQNFQDLMSSSMVKNIVELCTDQNGRTVYRGIPDMKTQHIQAEQWKSQRSKEEEKEREIRMQNRRAYRAHADMSSAFEQNEFPRPARESAGVYDDQQRRWANNRPTSAFDSYSPAHHQQSDNNYPTSRNNMYYRDGEGYNESPMSRGGGGGDTPLMNRGGAFGAVPISRADQQPLGRGGGGGYPEMEPPPRTRMSGRGAFGPSSTTTTTNYEPVYPPDRVQSRNDFNTSIASNIWANNEQQQRQRPLFEEVVPQQRQPPLPYHKQAQRYSSMENNNNNFNDGGHYRSAAISSPTKSHNGYFSQSQQVVRGSKNLGLLPQRKSQIHWEGDEEQEEEEEENDVGLQQPSPPLSSMQRQYAYPPTSNNLDRQQVQRETPNNNNKAVNVKRFDANVTKLSQADWDEDGDEVVYADVTNTQPKNTRKEQQQQQDVQQKQQQQPSASSKPKVVVEKQKYTTRGEGEYTDSSEELSEPEVVDAPPKPPPPQPNKKIVRRNSLESSTDSSTVNEALNKRATLPKSVSKQEAIVLPSDTFQNPGFNLQFNTQVHDNSTKTQRNFASHGEKWLFECQQRHPNMVKSSQSTNNTNLNKDADPSGSKLFRPIQPPPQQQQQQKQQKNAYDSSEENLLPSKPIKENLPTKIGHNKNKNLTRSPPRNKRGGPIDLNSDDSDDEDEVEDLISKNNSIKSTTSRNVVVVQPPPISQQQQQEQQQRYPPRPESVTSELSNFSIVRRTRSSNMTEPERKKMGKLLEGIVEYYFPRFILMADLIAIVELVDTRFPKLEQFIGFTHADFIQKYCPNVKLHSNGGYENLVWQAKDD